MNVLRFDSMENWTNAIATFWWQRLVANPSLRHCLPSGKTPLPVYQLMGKLSQQGAVSYKSSEIFALDEYGGLPPENEGRCANMLRRNLIGQIDLPATQFHFMDPDQGDPQKTCDAYDHAIGRGFDLAILGLGSNGHLGLNEPGSLPDSPTRRVEMHPASTKAAAQYVAQAALPTWGLTVGLHRLLESKEVWLLAVGRNKADIIRRVVCGEISPSVPASLLRKHPHCYVFVDDKAGSLL